MSHEVLVVIPTIMCHSGLYKLLDQLSKAQPVKTVLVIDNGNCFGIPETKHKVWQKCEHIRPNCNLNWLGSNNLGISIALERKIPYVCFLNDDVRLSSPGLFFYELLKTTEQHDKAGIVVPQYTGTFGEKANWRPTRGPWRPEDTETQVKLVDGTCMFMPLTTLQRVGFFDPVFRAPGWGADVDYSHRASEAGLEIYVSHRAMVWHYRKRGGRSATVIYGDVSKWVNRGRIQARQDLRAKYGSNWRNILPLPENAYLP